MYGKSGHLSIFTLLKHVMMLLKYNLFRVSKTLIADFFFLLDHIQLRFFFCVNIVKQCL